MTRFTDSPWRPDPSDRSPGVVEARRVWDAARLAVSAAKDAEHAAFWAWERARQAARST